MESLILELKRTLLQQIANGLTLIFAIGTLIGCLFILLKRRHHGRFYHLLWLLIPFMVIWRTITGVVSIRYVAMLLVPAAALTVFAGIGMERLLRLLHQKFPFFPQWTARAFSRTFCFCIFGGALLMAHHALSSQQEIHQQVYKFTRKYLSDNPGVTVLVRQEDESSFQYYTGARTAVYHTDTTSGILKVLRRPDSRGKHFLIALRCSPKTVPRFEKRHLPRGAEIKQLHTVQGRKKRKSAFFYRCTWDQKNARQ